MSTNYYMRLREPKRVKKKLFDIVDWRYGDMLPKCMANMDVELLDDEAVHIAKCSWGWVPNFQAVPTERPFDETERNNDRYSIASVDDIRAYMSTGAYEIVDEYGEVIGMDEFEREVVGWCDVQRENGFEGEFRCHSDKPDALGSYLDKDGNQFSRVCFC